MTAYTPNLPALINWLPGDASRAPQTEFDRARQVLFLENLSVTGSVPSAASAAQVRHQSAGHLWRASFGPQGPLRVPHAVGRLARAPGGG